MRYQSSFSEKSFDKKQYVLDHVRSLHICQASVSNTKRGWQEYRARVFWLDYADEKQTKLRATMLQRAMPLTSPSWDARSVARRDVIRQHMRRKRGSDIRRGVGKALGAVAQPSVPSKAPWQRNQPMTFAGVATKFDQTCPVYYSYSKQEGWVRRTCQEFLSFLVSLLRVSRSRENALSIGIADFLHPQQTKKYRDGHQFRGDVPDWRLKFLLHKK